MNESIVAPAVIKPPEKSDVVIAALKARYSELAAKEDIGNTPATTAECDHLEGAIREMMRK